VSFHRLAAIFSLRLSLAIRPCPISQPHLPAHAIAHALAGTAAPAVAIALTAAPALSLAGTVAAHLARPGAVTIRAGTCTAACCRVFTLVRPVAILPTCGPDHTNQDDTNEDRRKNYTPIHVFSPYSNTLFFSCFLLCIWFRNDYVHFLNAGYRRLPAADFHKFRHANSDVTAFVPAVEPLGPLRVRVS
jgi:hypothetical protein